MKLNFNFQFAAESCKLTTSEITTELGAIECPINVELELDASEVQQASTLIRDLAKQIPDLLKQKHASDIDLIERKAKLDEHIAQVRYKLEADNIKLKADLAGKLKEQKPATRAKKQSEPNAELNAFEVFDHT